ncbi:hypothetical protein [Providencia rettgeri]|uniref:hypothetical protein n=1 Tax=Providencia rettgeri TaxID=587 RepID=UPI00235FB2C7|nr:hypothetical protein [Providencia rettgeri]
MNKSFKDRDVTYMSVVDSDRKYPTQKHGGSNGGDGMDSRISKLEAEVSKIKDSLNDIKIDVAVIKSNYAKKEDVVSSSNKIILWVVGAVVFSQLLPALPKIIDAFLK